MLFSAPATSKVCRLCFKPCIFLFSIYLLFVLIAYSEYKNNTVKTPPVKTSDDDNVDDPNIEIEILNEPLTSTIKETKAVRKSTRMKKTTTVSTEEFQAKMTGIDEIANDDDNSIIGMDESQVDENAVTNDSQIMQDALNEPIGIDEVNEQIPNNQEPNFENAISMANEEPKSTEPNENIKEDISEAARKRIVPDFYAMLENPPGKCNNIMQVGGDYIYDSNNQLIKDGQKDVCEDASEMGFQPLEKGNCTVYSFGVGYDWSFEKESLRSLKCKVYAFDPEPKYYNHGRDFEPLPGLKFYARGVGSRNGNIMGDEGSEWKLQTLDTIMRQLGHDKVDVLKMDIQGWEWPALEQMIFSESLKKINHLCIELHFSISRMNNQIRITKSLEKLGFRMFSAHANPTIDWTFIRNLNRKEKLQYEVAWYRV